MLDQLFVTPDWKVGTLTRRVGQFFTGWDDALFRGLLDRFAIRTTAQIGTLSRGEGVKLSLAMALTE